MNSNKSCPYPRQRYMEEESGNTRSRIRTSLPCNTVLAMAYVPYQQMGETYSCEKALSVGTVFPCLNLPFVGCCR